MFLFLPVRVEEPRRPMTVPVVNYALIAINVIVFWLGWSPHWTVGPGTWPHRVLLYAFGHASASHLIWNMYALWLFGNVANRRLGNVYYLTGYLFVAVCLGVLVRVLSPWPVIGSSGAVFGVMVMCFLLVPSARVHVGFFALFPVTILVGLVMRPKEWVFWFIRWDVFLLRAWWGLLLIPGLEILSLWVWGWNWTNLGHLLGCLFGLAWVLLLPDRISLKRPTVSHAGHA